jgi:hypothetical protein
MQQAVTTIQVTKTSAKRTPNAFMLFSQEHRAEARAQHPNLSHSELSKLLGQQWKNLHPDRKKVYRDKAEALKAESLLNPAAAITKRSKATASNKQRQDATDGSSDALERSQAVEAREDDKHIESLLSQLVHFNQTLNSIWMNTERT